MFYRSTGYEKRVRSCLTSYPFSVATCLPAVKLVCFQTFLIGGWQMVRGVHYLIQYSSEKSIRSQRW